MKDILIPPPIVLTDPITGERVNDVRGDGAVIGPSKPVTFAAHALGWLNMPAFGDAEGIAMLPDLVKALREAPVGGAWRMGDAEHVRLEQAAAGYYADPTRRPSPLILMQLTPFREALKNAQTVPAAVLAAPNGAKAEPS